jgi:ABC-type uncharacterized transport system ATPase subunit
MEELSHGMAQLVQIVSTVLHEPKLLIFDEPFNGLDPVNMQLVKDIIAELRDKGKALILSTHRMNEVEELCDSVYMISKGRGVLQGQLADIKKRFPRQHAGDRQRQPRRQFLRASHLSNVTGNTRGCHGRRHHAAGRY